MKSIQVYYVVDGQVRSSTSFRGRKARMAATKLALQLCDTGRE